MPNYILRYRFIFFGLLLFSCINNATEFEVVGLSYNKAFEISNQESNAFSWKIKTESNNWKQGAYQILVSSSEKDINNSNGNYWDSGKIFSDEQLFVSYKGSKLVSGEKYYWKIKVWDESGINFKWSKVESFATSIKYPQDWKANWITFNYLKEGPMPLLRKAFQLKSANEPVSARLYICGLGYYEAYLNGRKIGDRLLEPAQTNYEDYAFYTAYEIPVKEIGKNNCLGIMPGNGWYNQNLVWTPAMAYGQPIAIAQLIIKFKDGHSETIITDSSWKWKEGPITFNNIYAGEAYNANLEISNWSKFDNDEKGWEPVKLATGYPSKMFEETIEPIRRMDSLKAIRILEPSDKKWVFDFGQNFAGWARLKISGQKGQKITLRFSEEIDKNNNIDPTSTGVCATKYVQTDQYICKGEGVEVWEPRFTYHGFRYVEVTGLETKPEKDLLKGIVVYSSMKKAGTFSCSDPQINKLHDLALWTIKSNIHGIPTDCPHRERCGWTGDAHTIATTLIQNFDARLFLTKYLYDMRSSARESRKELYFGVNFQDRSIVTKPAGIPTMIVPGKRTSGVASPDWGTAAVQIPWYLYQYYGELNLLHEFYPDMKTWVDYISAKFPEGIVNHGLGDWCPPGGNKMIDCPVSLSSTAFHYLDLSILAKTAYLFGYLTDASYYTERLNKVKERFNGQFFDAIQSTYGSQTANAMAIQLGLVPDGKIKEVVGSLAQDIKNKSNGFIQTGIFGLGRIFPALNENGAEDLAFNILTKTGNHSFANMWEKLDATTLWEVLPVDDVLSYDDLNKRSHSHPMNAGYDEWFFRGIAGIHQDGKSAGFKNIVFRPYFTSKLTNASASYDSPYGTIESNWNWKDKSFIWNIKIPANSGANLYIPKLFDKQQVFINGQDKRLNLSEDPAFPDFYLYKSVGNGGYHITIITFY
jgi:alpha-L-rhamnosidase